MLDEPRAEQEEFRAGLDQEGAALEEFCAEQEEFRAEQEFRAGLDQEGAALEEFRAEQEEFRAGLDQERAEVDQDRADSRHDKYLAERVPNLAMTKYWVVRGQFYQQLIMCDSFHFLSC